MLTRLDLRGAGDGDWRARLPRPTAATNLPVDAVRAILADVKADGDEAVRALTEKFDGVRLESLRVPPHEVAAALEAVPAALREALEAARANILAYHRHQVRADERHERDGLVVRELYRPVDRAGLCIPGGEAPLMSTVLMTAIPARVAGVPEVVLCSPPTSGGTVAPGILAAAALAGVDEVYRIGGAQAVAAMAYGTETIRPVDVIVGPGGLFTTVAKQQVAAEGVVGVPGSFAGPSEVVVVADDATPVTYAAIDVIVQVEHGPDSVGWLITWSEGAADRIEAEVARLAAANPRRSTIEANLAANGYSALVDGPEEAIAVANAIAPEHLELMVSDPEALLPLVRHAGAVFTGAFAPASVGDYLAGPSHVLPTYGSARFSEALRVDDFVKAVHVVSLDQPTLTRIGPHVAAIAEAEGLPAHAASVQLRWQA
ncbi:MAG TPA: histidinol dehydrogenase [Acidimicrobiales bacterium]|nr:histidinol dehydrogenase [Acidimicrobiales bacterium]